MAKLSVFSVLSNIQILFFTLRRGKRVGEDQHGNIYYRGKPRRGSKRERRWVLYNGTPEASKIPPEWHGWMHHQSEEIPPAPRKKTPYRQKWQQQHHENRTGTENAYLPPGTAKGSKRATATGDYGAWVPPK